MLLQIALVAALAATPPTPTPLGELELAAVLRDGHHFVFGTFPSRRRLGVAWAQTALECGRGAKTIGWNVGQIGALEGQPFHWIAGHKFRDYDDAIDGARSYWFAVKPFTRALHSFDAGDPGGAARALSGHYFRANADDYARAMLALYAVFVHSVDPLLYR